MVERRLELSHSVWNKGGHQSSPDFRQEDNENPDAVVDVEDPDDSGIARIQRENMLELYSGDHPELKVAFEEWQRTHASLERRITRGIVLASFIRNEIYHLLGVFIVVEGVLLTTLGQANVLTCENRWDVVTLAAVASLILIVPLIQRLSAYWCIRRRIATLRFGLQGLARQIYDMKTLGPLQFKFSDHLENVARHDILKKPAISSSIFRMAIITTVILFLMFLILIGTQIHCDESGLRQSFRSIYYSFTSY